MKKNLLTLLALFCIATFSYSQNPVPNPSFENWIAGSPDGWFTNNVAGFANFINQVTPGQTGTYAAQGMPDDIGGNFLAPSLTSTNMLGDGFAVTQSYANLNFYYKFNKASTNFFQILVVMLDAVGGASGIGTALITNSATNFTSYNVPISYINNNAAECVIYFIVTDTTAAGVVDSNSYFIVDNVSLNGSVGIIENTGILQSMLVSPNPASTEITVSYSQTTSGTVELSVVDLSGREVMSKTSDNDAPGNHNTNLNIAQLKEGFYLCKLKSMDGIAVKRFQVRHH